MKKKDIFLILLRAAVALALFAVAIIYYEPLAHLDIRKLLSFTQNYAVMVAVILAVYVVKALVFVLPASVIYVAVGTILPPPDTLPASGSELTSFTVPASSMMAAVTTPAMAASTTKPMITLLRNFLSFNRLFHWIFFIRYSSRIRATISIDNTITHTHATCQDGNSLRTI